MASTAASRPSYMVDPFIMVASSAASVSARLVAHPIDTIRIRIQTYPGSTLPPLTQLVPKPRIRNLYAGLPVAIGFGVPALSAYLMSYEVSKRYFGDKLLPREGNATILQQLPVFMLSGLAAELVSGGIWTPMDVLKSRLQHGSEGTSAMKLVGKILKEEGLKGFYKGYWLGNAIFVPQICTYWSVYESLKTRFIPGYNGYRTGVSNSASNVETSSSTSLTNETIPIPLRYTLCSVVACALSVSLTNPIEVVQARWQTSGTRSQALGGVQGIVKTLYAQGGLSSFTKGLGVRVAYALPANAISMSVYEGMKKWKGIA
ncbi:hypothetical protein OIO90_001017 [Microbotryomycetes sp. JL221]|nr:hypothetical protein OIO90_001017 [Microbotryomycetes sp. JL221]